MYILISSYFFRSSSDFLHNLIINSNYKLQQAEIFYLVPQSFISLIDDF